MEKSFSLTQHNLIPLVSKNGEYKIKSNQPDENGMLEVVVYNGKTIIAQAAIRHHGFNIKGLDEHECDEFGMDCGTFVKPPHRRKGLATAMYLHAEKATGLKTVPAAGRSSDALAL